MTTLYLTITYLASVAIASYYFIKMGMGSKDKFLAALCILPVTNTFYAASFALVEVVRNLRQLSDYLDNQIDLWAIRRYNSYKEKQSLR